MKKYLILSLLFMQGCQLLSTTDITPASSEIKYNDSIDITIRTPKDIKEAK